MRFNGLRKYYFEKRIKEKEMQFCSDKKMNRLSIRQITQSDIKRSAFNDQKSSKNKRLNFNGQNDLNIKKNLFFDKNDKENFSPNENIPENKINNEKQENTPKNNDNNNYNSNNISKNNYFNNIRLSRYNKLKLRLSMPIYIENNYNTNNEETKKDKNNNINNNSIYNNIGANVTFDCEIDDLINSTTSKIENEKEQKDKNNSEFAKYLQKVKTEKLSKNNLTKGSLAIIQMEITHAKDAIFSNKYISYVNKNNIDNKNDNICFRLGKNSMCVCGHGFSRHNLYLFRDEFKINCKKCKCDEYKYIPVFPEETNEYTKAYLLDFKYDEWKAGCKCGHNWTKHNFIDGEKCEECKCKSFESNFSCGVCGDIWENHIILIQTKEEREKKGEKTGNDYEPFTKEQIGKLLNY